LNLGACGAPPPPAPLAAPVATPSIAASPPPAEGAAPSANAKSTPPEPARAVIAPPSGPRIHATEGIEFIRAKPAWDAPVIGTFRAGQSIALARPEPAAGPGVARCAGGWYAVVPRGYVCAGPRSTVADDDPRVAAAAAALPDPGGVMPFHYGVSVGTPRYRRIPTPADQRRAEPGLDAHLAHPPPPDPRAGGAVDLAAAGSPPPAALERWFA
jgi:hypothetical protein